MSDQTYRDLLQARGRGLSEAEASMLLEQVLPQLVIYHNQGQGHGGISIDTIVRQGMDSVLLPGNGDAYANPSEDIHQLGLTLITILTNKSPDSRRRPDGNWDWQDECLVSEQFAALIDRSLSSSPVRFINAMGMQEALQSGFQPDNAYPVSGDTLISGPPDFYNPSPVYEQPSYQQQIPNSYQNPSPVGRPIATRPPWFWGAVGAGGMTIVSLILWTVIPKSVNPPVVGDVKNSSESASNSGSTITPTPPSPVPTPTNVFDQATFPQSSCGDPLPSNKSAYPVNFYPVFVPVSDRNLQMARSRFCQDSLAVTRTDTGRKAIQVSSFTDSGKAAQFRDYLARSISGPEIGPPTVVEAKAAGF